MKNIKKVVSLGAIVFAIGATSVTAFAASNYTTRAEAVAGLTGKTVNSVNAERSEEGKTYGGIAKDAGKLTEFKAEVLEMKKDALAKKVEEGTITQEKADLIITKMEERQASCDGTGALKGSRKSGEGRVNPGEGLGNRNGKCIGSGYVK
ncbi:DUF2680 domain-containing protein [Clostridium algidicarnis]|uniref:DUF2680 domain-containing protein n=1 Tax=Clostridium algidicarnis TaxID=37659 RepID=UPI000496187D|nr:DUF2680 domain-containing protein [Clostridium algidicarnis]